MSQRIIKTRKYFYAKMKVLGTPGKWDNVIVQRGMFSYTGLTRMLIQLSTTHKDLEDLKEREHSSPGHFVVIYVYCKQDRLDDKWDNQSRLIESEQTNHLREKYHIYLTGDGRMNMCGLNASNMDYVVNAFHETITGQLASNFTNGNGFGDH
ncbi:hypothetical protein ACTXT7_011867 [Hymenolepis weldensis]